MVKTWSVNFSLISFSPRKRETCQSSKEIIHRAQKTAIKSLKVKKWSLKIFKLKQKTLKIHHFWKQENRKFLFKMPWNDMKPFLKFRKKTKKQKHKQHSTHTQNTRAAMSDHMKCSVLTDCLLRLDFFLLYVFFLILLFFFRFFLQLPDPFSFKWSVHKLTKAFMNAFISLLFSSQFICVYLFIRVRSCIYFVSSFFFLSNCFFVIVAVDHVSMYFRLLLHVNFSSLFSFNRINRYDLAKHLHKTKNSTRPSIVYSSL